jgi:endonuclease/exonuclease/phosphatase family metal-dependent hydrolase
MPTVRILSYNVRSMRDDPAALGRVITRLRPDVVCLQEVPRLAFWRRRRRRLAAGTHLTLVVGRRAAGLEVAAGPRVTVLHREHHLLTPVPRHHRRALALAVLEVGGARLAVASVHLDLVAAARWRHAAEITRVLDRVRAEFAAPVVVAGDVNEEPGGAVWDLFAGCLRDAHAVAPYGETATFSAARPRRRIDGVFTDPGIEVVGCGVPDDAELLADYPRASDHRPVLAELRVPVAYGGG